MFWYVRHVVNFLTHFAFILPYICLDYRVSHIIMVQTWNSNLLLEFLLSCLLLPCFLIRSLFFGDFMFWGSLDLNPISSSFEGKIVSKSSVWVVLAWVFLNGGWRAIKYIECHLTESLLSYYFRRKNLDSGRAGFESQLYWLYSAAWLWTSHLTSKLHFPVYKCALSLSWLWLWYSSSVSVLRIKWGNIC